jgi:hypothetical protein
MVLPSSTDLFFFYGQTLEKCARFRRVLFFRSARSVCISNRSKLTVLFALGRYFSSAEGPPFVISSRSLQSGLSSTPVRLAFVFLLLRLPSWSVYLVQSSLSHRHRGRPS